MKRLIAVLLSISMLFGLSVVYAAGKSEINDGLDDNTQVFSASDDVKFGETTSALGDYKDPVYATSAVGTMEIVYELENMAGFELVTLNYKKYENIKLYTSADNVDYTEITDAERDVSALTSNWEKISYSAAVNPETAKYLKIVIVQEKAKYIRLDNVNIYSDTEPELVSYELFKDDEEAEGQNLIGVNKLVIHYNQAMEKAPLTISSSENSETIDGEYGDSRKDIIYTFDALSFGIYTFSIDGLKTVTGKTAEFSERLGEEIVFGIQKNIYLSDSFDVSEVVQAVKDTDENEYIPENVVVTVSDEYSDILIAENNKITPKLPGKAILKISFTLGEDEVSYDYEVRVCAPKSAEISPDDKKLSVNESFDIEVKILLDDDTETEPSEIAAVSTDETVASVSGNTVTAISKGNAFITVTANYYGYSFEKTIAVGVEKETLAAFSEAVISVNKDELAIGSGAETVLSGKSSDNSNIDMTAASCKYFSDSEDIIEISSDGRLSAKKAGTAKIYADVTVGGITVRTNTISVRAVSDYVVSAALLCDRLFFENGDTKELSVQISTLSGNSADSGVNAKYISENKSVADFSGNTLTAKASGTAVVYAEVSYGGKTVSTPKYTVSVADKTGEFSKNFKNGDWSETLSHTDGLSIGSDGVSLKSGENQYIAVSSKSSIANLTLTGMSYGSVGENDVTVLVSKTDDTDESYEKVTLNTETSGSGKLNFTMKNTAAINDAKFLRIYIGASTVRLESIEIIYNAAPEILGVTELTSTGAVRGKAMPEMVNIAFSQTIDESSVSGISVAAEDGSTADISVTVSGKSCNIALKDISNTDYTLLISGVKNANGIEMNGTYTYVISKTADTKSIVSENVSVSGNTASADIINNGESVSADVVFVIFDENGSAVAAVKKKNYQVSSGNNNISVSIPDGGKTAKVYIWSRSDIPTVLD